MADLLLERARRIRREGPPPPGETLLERGRRLLKKPEQTTAPQEESPEEEQGDPSNGSGASGIRLRASLGSMTADTYMDTPQPVETVANLSTGGEANPLWDLPVSMIHASWFPGRQGTAAPRLGLYASYRNFRAIREADGFSQETEAHLIGAGLTVTAGPFISPKLDGIFRTLLSWPGVATNIGIGGLQVSGGIAVARVDVDVTRPNPLDARERGGEWAFATSLPVPLYGELEATLVYLRFGDEEKPVAQITLGLDSYLFMNAAGRPTGGWRDFLLGDPTTEGDFKASGLLHPTLGFEIFFR